MTRTSRIRWTRSRARLWCAAAIGVAALLVASVRAQQGTTNGEWRRYSGDNGSTKYAPLDQITAQNIAQLRIAWRRPALDARFTNPTFSNSFQSTPLMIGGVLFANNGLGFMEAFDAGTGRTIWVQEPEDGKLDGLRGPAPRGVAYWSGGADARVFNVRGKALYAVDAKTGKPAAGFGDNGKVSLSHLGQLGGQGYYWLSAPVVCRDVVIIGSASSDNARNREDRPGDVTAYDVRTGKLLWTFNVIPRDGEFGADTWKEGARAYTGAANVWTLFTADEELGYVYLPTSSPTADWFGGHRLGSGLFAESLVAVDVTSGKRVWHFQGVHHGLWDYDFPAAPILGDVTVNGRTIKAVFQISKQAFLFAFDRATGEPIWPIEERPVPASTTPREQAWPTQPFPTRPAPFDRQGLTTDDLIDFTPALRAEALELSKQYVMGPLFTPPSLSKPDGTKGTIVVPGWAGGGNWGGGAFDPQTGVLYIPSVTDPSLEGLVEQDPGKGSVLYIREQLTSVPGPQGLPLTKPPYGRITAIDMNRGEHVWMVPNGDGPRNHPLLKDLNLPPLGSSGRVGPVLTKTLLFVGEGDPVIVATPPLGGGRKFRAYDKTNGTVVWETEFPAGTTGAPMTYMHNGTQYIVVAIGSKEHTAEFVALALASRIDSK